MSDRISELVDATVEDLEARYEFLDELGTGATSSVYLARRREAGASASAAEEEVALKIIDVRALADDDIFSAVHCEIGLLRLARHPFVVRLVEVVRDSASLAIVTEALVGGDLFGVLSERGALSAAPGMAAPSELKCEFGSGGASVGAAAASRFFATNKRW